MTKQGGSVKTWKRRWFVLKGNALYYFKTNKPGSEAQGLIEITVDTKVNRETKNGKAYAFSVSSPRRLFFMYPDEAGETEPWMKSINTGVQKLKNPSRATAQPIAQAPQHNVMTVPARTRLLRSKTDIAFLKERDAKLTEFWQLWFDSIPAKSELTPGLNIDFEIGVSADMQRVTCRVQGPQNLFIQKMVDFFWNVGAPEIEIDKLNDVGQRLNPPSIGSWVEMSARGGMDGGWVFPTDVPISSAIDAADMGDATRKLIDWASTRNVRDLAAVARDMGAAPPRQTEFRIKMPGSGYDDQVATALSAFSAMGAPSLPEDVLVVMRQAGWKSGVRLSVVTSADGLVRIGVMLPDPDAIVLDKLCALGGGSSSAMQSFGRLLDILSKDSAPDVAGKHYVEFFLTLPPYDYGVYKPGFDVMFHFNLGQEWPN